VSACLLLALTATACGPEVTPAASTGASGQVETTAPTAVISATADLGLALFMTGEATGGNSRPDFTQSTVPALDEIAFVPYQRLHSPEDAEVEGGSHFGWSPDGRYFLTHKGSDKVIRIGPAGYGLADLYLGDGETGEVKFLQENAGWPSWSRDGQWIYYLTGMKAGERPRYDLYRRSLGTGESALVVEDVGAPGTEQAAVEIGEGRLVLLDKDYRAALFENGVITPLSALVGVTVPQEVVAENYAVAPDGHTVAVFSGQAPLYIVDIETRTLEGTAPARLDNDRPVAWSADSRRFAFANCDGLFIYNRDTQTTNPVVTRKDLGMRDEDITACFYQPIWSPNEDVLLFGTLTEDWEITNGRNSTAGIKFAVTIDGSYLRALSDSTTLTLSRDKTRGLGSFRDVKTWESVRVLMTMVWRKP